MNLSFICDAVGAQLLTPMTTGLDLKGISIDSRRVNPGELFAALTGPHFDGHDFIETAVEKGCAAVLAQRPPPTLPNVPVLLVPDVLAALGQAGNAWRRHINPITIAVTGSSGKTTVKEMIAACLLQEFKRIHATQGNLNNHIGVPLTLLSIPVGCQAMVVEMGMSAPGEIAHLTRLAQPDIGVITNVQPAHMAAFSSIREVAAAKGELFSNLESDGVCLLPIHDANQAVLLEMAHPRRIITFGPDPGAMVHWKTGSTNNNTEIRGAIRWQDGASASIHLGQYGPHMILNALAAAGAARTAGVSPCAITDGLSDFTPMAGRGLIQQIHGMTLIDDTYNANPGSMAAALATLGRRPVPERRIAILGDMLELGETAEQLHKDLADEILKNGVELLITAGPLMRSLHNALLDQPGVTSLHKNDPADWLGTISPLLRTRDAILVKGSRGMRMERIVKDLINHAV
ncbi:MAG: UDP-N-acetylmuramoyl-tripeptide--D-alanyl-D-alanine ligase [Magnetococcus sp. YQC-5]